MRPLSSYRIPALQKLGFTIIGEESPYKILTKGEHKIYVCEGCMKARYEGPLDELRLMGRDLYLRLHKYYHKL